MPEDSIAIESEHDLAVNIPKEIQPFIKINEPEEVTNATESKFMFFNGDQRSETLRKVSKMPFEKIVQIAKQTRNEYQEKSEGDIHLAAEIAALYFGQLAVDPKMDDRITRQEESIRSARMQQRVVRLMLYASRPDSSPEVQNRVMNLLLFQDALADNIYYETGPVVRIKTEIDSNLAAERAQAGIITTLQESGHEIYLPPLGGSTDEVAEWDVRHGVDFLVKYEDEDENDVFLLCDSKSEAWYSNLILDKEGKDIKGKGRRRGDEREDVDVILNHYPLTAYDSLPKSLRNFIPQGSEIMRANIIVPSPKNSMMSLSRAYKEASEGSVSETIFNYIKLNGMVDYDVITGIDEGIAQVRQSKNDSMTSDIMY